MSVNVSIIVAASNYIHKIQSMPDKVLVHSKTLSPYNHIHYYVYHLMIMRHIMDDHMHIRNYTYLILLVIEK